MKLRKRKTKYFFKYLIYNKNVFPYTCLLYKDRFFNVSASTFRSIHDLEKEKNGERGTVKSKESNKGTMLSSKQEFFTR